MDIGTAPDIDSSTIDYALRFSGIAGEYLLSVQNRAINKVLPLKGKIIDVGGGHLQILNILDLDKVDYTLHGSDTSCFTRVTQTNLKKIVCPLLDLNVDDESYDTAISIRQLSHLQDWKLFIKELTRVAKNTVIIDAPLNVGFNKLTDILFSFKKKFEKNTRRYLNFSEQELIEVFRENNFILADSHKQFFFPMVIHRILKNEKISKIIELIPEKIGLTKCLGSPAIFRFDRLKK